MEVTPICHAHKVKITIFKLLECYNVMKEEYKDEDPRTVQIPYTERAHVVQGLVIAFATYTHPIKTKNVNIGTTNNPKFSHIGDYWSDETIEKFANLLRQYHDLFPTKFSDMKGIEGDIGKMKIPLKPGAKPIRQRPYKLNLRYKDKVKAEIDKMLEVGIIEPVEESKWIIPIVM
jgi:hypothetical protein